MIAKQIPHSPTSHCDRQIKTKFNFPWSDLEGLLSPLCSLARGEGRGSGRLFYIKLSGQYQKRIMIVLSRIRINLSHQHYSYYNKHPRASGPWLRLHQSNLTDGHCFCACVSGSTWTLRPSIRASFNPAFEGRREEIRRLLLRRRGAPPLTL